MKCYWLMNHDFTNDQRKELESRFSVDQILQPSTDFKSIWSSLPPGEEFYPELVDSWIDLINCPDIAVVQGDSTYSFYVVDALLKKGVRVFASTTERIAEENVLGCETRIYRIFRHKAFREYRRRRS